MMVQACDHAKDCPVGDECMHGKGEHHVAFFAFSRSGYDCSKEHWCWTLETNVKCAPVDGGDE